MPELPEVENARRLAQQHAAGKKFTKVIAADDNKVIEGIAPKDLEKALTGQKLVAAHRKGKQMWFELDDSSGSALLLHLGMKGSLKVEGVKSAEYQQGTKDGGEWPPRFWKIQFEMDDGTRMAFNDARRFARVRFLKDPTSVPPISELGFDPLLELPPLDDFVALMAKQRRALKALILDQSFSAGVGNWVADEVLYQARLHPEQKGSSLDADECKRLHDALFYVCKTATEVDAESSQFPPDWLFHQRWNEKKAQPINGNPLEFIKSAGRATAIVPAVQKLRDQAPKATKEKASSKKKTAGKRKSDESAGEESESEAEDPAPPAKRGRGAQKANAESTKAAAKGKSNGQKREKAASKDVAAADKKSGAAASEPKDESQAESDPEEPALPAKRGRGAKKTKAELPEATAKGKSNGRKGRKGVGKDAAAAGKKSGAGTVASKPSDESQADSDDEETAPPAKRGRGARKAKSAEPEATEKGKSEHRKRVLAAGKAVAAADKVPGNGAAASMHASKSGAGREGAQPVGKTSSRRKAKMGKQDPAGPTAPSHYEAIASAD